MARPLFAASVLIWALSSMARMRRYGGVDNGWATVVALDPGGTTGWSVMCVESDALSDPDISILKSIVHWRQGQVAICDEDDHVAALVELLAVWPHAAVVIEDFILRKYVSGRELLSPVRITAKVAYVFNRGLEGIEPPGRKIFRQQPSLAMSTATDARLKDWNLYVREGGEEHARDATRHAITFLRRASEKPKLRRMAWPWLYECDGNVRDCSLDVFDFEDA